MANVRKHGEVAEAIYEAASDGTEKLRYPVGHDAVPLLEPGSKWTIWRLKG